MGATNINKNECIVRLKTSDGVQYIGSGVLYSDNNIGERVYILTTAHCLFEDSDTFSVFRKSIVADIYSPITKKYEEIPVNNLKDVVVMRTEKTNDLAVIVLAKKSITKIAPELPSVKVVSSNADVNNIIALGFPKATNHKEIFTAPAKWLNERVGSNQFILQCEADLTEDYSRGFSGGGLFLQSNDEILLLGLFSRFLMEERGRQIYGQSLNEINLLLDTKNLPSISLGFIGVGGLCETSLIKTINQSLKNLGPNFNPDLNLKTNTHRYIDAIIRNRRYRMGLFKSLDGWFNDINSSLIL